MIILASASPRRRELLEQIGCKFTIETSKACELKDANLPPEELVVENARRKAADVAARFGENAVAIGADTVVFLDGRILGKPADAREAKEMLAALAGKKHVVYTGVAVARNGECQTDYEKTTVELGAISDEDIDRYVATKEPLDKAGAYAVQGKAAVFVRAIEGSYSNVVGLPLFCLANLCRRAGIELSCW